MLLHVQFHLSFHFLLSQKHVHSLNVLNQEEKQIINYRYFKDYTQSETAKILGLSQVKVSRYEKKSLNKMYNYLAS